MPSAMRGARPPLYESRPDGVLEAIRDKFAAARPGGWLQDSADNYEFLSFGSGVAAVEALAKRARPGEVVAILDAGAGSGGFMARARDVCARHAIPARIVGTTADSRKAQVGRSRRWDEPLPGDGGGDRGGVELDHVCGFPLEDVARCGATAFGARRRFDLIVCSWTLIHLADPLGTLEALCALLAPGGVLLANEACADVGPPARGGAPLEAFAGCCRAAGLELAVEGAELTYDDERGFERGYYTAVRYVRPKRGAGAPRFRLAHTGELGQLHVLASGAQYSVAKYAIAPSYDYSSLHGHVSRRLAAAPR